VNRVGDKGQIVATDILEMEAIPGVTFLQADFLDNETPEKLIALLGGPADLVLSDLASPTVGHRQTDHIRTITLLELAVDLALQVLAPGGVFVGKVFQGGATGDLLNRLKKHFREVKHAKPPASRAESVEMYVVAKGFKK
jgi:23S rRNA (uridine2552-2'-O)-methyltransferase